jgi:3',5'-nucleoside bisphosphate phosphatase
MDNKYIYDRNLESNWTIDMHVHTSVSDGETSPMETVHHALKHNLKVITITDHNCVHDQFENLQNYAKGLGLSIPFPGMEVSTFYADENIFLKFHLLCYGDGILNIDFKQYVEVNNYKQYEYYLNKYSELKKQGIELFPIEELQQVDSMEDDVLSKKYLIGKYKIRRYLAEKLHLTFDEVEKHYFKDYLECKSHFDDQLLNITDVLKYAKDLGCVTILAHPLRKLKGTNKEIIEHVIKNLSNIGLDGIEVGHRNNYPDFNYLTDLAKKYHLITSGGSDYHGNADHWFGNYGSTTKELNEISYLLKKRAKF